MHLGAVGELLQSLQNDQHGWTVEVPGELGLFLGHSLSLRVTTRIGYAYVDDPTLGPPLSIIETELARLILENLSFVLPQAERALRDYAASNPSDLRNIADPALWIDRETLEMDGSQSWSVVVHRSDWPNFGWHIEFDGLELDYIWAGD